MSCNLNAMQADLLLTTLAKDYKIYAPKRFIAQGRFSDTDIISYGEVEKFNDIVWDTKPDYPAKEVITPNSASYFLFYRRRISREQSTDQANTDFCASL